MHWFIAPAATLLLFLPLLTAIAALLSMSKQVAHSITTAGVFCSFLLSITVSYLIFNDASYEQYIQLYHWADGQQYFDFKFSISLLVDKLTCLMLVMVSGISLLVHIYSIGYLHQDKRYQVFFSYISFFTFAMFLLVLADNLLQMFIGWECVGVASYLLIGFWFQKESATIAGFKAFLVNRVSDFFMLLGLALLFYYIGDLHYQVIFNSLLELQKHSLSFAGVDISAVTAISLLLFIGAMGKSAQMPLHIWLPDSMEGPTPISALIHAATMVTAGIYLVARLSPLFATSAVVLDIVTIVGATGALFMGILAIVNFDIKKIIAYSTLSQLGYMVVALGCSAYGVSIFHLLTHACFKALLFLSAGVVIMATHQQDIRYMGGLYRHLPVAYIATVVGSLALVGLPPFAGFFSKDLIIISTTINTNFAATYAYYCVTLGTLVTSIYSARLILTVFHGQRSADVQLPVKWSMQFPLLVLTLLSLLIGILLYDLIIPGTQSTLSSLLPLPLIAEDISKYTINTLVYHGFTSMPFMLIIIGVVLTLVMHSYKIDVAKVLNKYTPRIYTVLKYHYGFDKLYQKLFVDSLNSLSAALAHKVDDQLLDQRIVDGSAVQFARLSRILQLIQTGLVNHYIIMMLLGIFAGILLIIWI